MLKNDLDCRSESARYCSIVRSNLRLRGALQTRQRNLQSCSSPVSIWMIASTFASGPHALCQLKAVQVFLPWRCSTIPPRVRLNNWAHCWRTKDKTQKTDSRQALDKPRFGRDSFTRAQSAEVMETLARLWRNRFGSESFLL